MFNSAAHECVEKQVKFGEKIDFCYAVWVFSVQDASDHDEHMWKQSSRKFEKRERKWREKCRRMRIGRLRTRFEIGK